ncbi:MAG: hypothetical protein J6K52_01770 [Clostridia bacterium]|nr:hypothetical protein [Clostridia bacterium]
MELWQEIICNTSKIENINESIISKIDLTKLLNSTCYIALKRIKEVIENNNLSDAECFAKIEEIICIFEGLSSNGGDRHDF